MKITEEVITIGLDFYSFGFLLFVVAECLMILTAVLVVKVSKSVLVKIASCDSSSIRDNVRPSVCWLVGPSIGR